ncbi:MAG: hypothetical protein AAFP69_24100, partial [Planctomycetota bacterium]
MSVTIETPATETHDDAASRQQGFTESNFSQPDDAVFPYRAISRMAIASVIVGVLGLIGLVPDFWPVLAFGALAMLLGTFGIFTIKRYPEEYSGSGPAIAGITLGALVLVVGVSMNTYIYLTEVPEGYTRVGFYELQQEDDSGFDGPTARAGELHNELIFLKGYIHPSSGAGMLTKFILIPDLGTCCFGGDPKSSDMVEVTLPPGESVKVNLFQKKLAGEFRVDARSLKKQEFQNPVFYRLNVDQ